MSQVDGYNGWSNYETWLVSLHIDNDPALHEESLRLAERAKETFPMINELEDATQRSAEHELTEQLENIVRNIVEDKGINSLMVKDLIHGAINSVDFREIAESKLSEAQEEVKI